MKQIITQHGWGLDQSFWNIYKVEFQKNKWYWQDNERGYFSKIPNQSKWNISKTDKQIKMILCHSLGFHLIQKSLFKEATHIIFINSFNNFLPLGSKRKLIIKSLKRMEKKIIQYKTKSMLQEFVKRSFMPNDINIDFQNIYYGNLESLNKSLLLEDLQELYQDRDVPEILTKNCKIISIQSKNDFILDRDSSNNFVKLLRNKFGENLTVINMPNQGHCLTNLNLYEFINNYLAD